MDLHYNAFISYRHHPQDIKVAEAIHRGLERFRVPKALKQQGKKIDRLFRDKEELPITSSLTDTITMALQNSDYQIVICSTHLKNSYWVQREIETFLQTHTKDKVLTVLVDGDNPYDVIPEILTYNEVIDPETGEVKREPIEPLSCDWRMSKRKAMKEELPRLAAVLLGCSYDELRQRQKQYRMRRLTAGLSIGTAASLALAGYFLHTSIQIQENLDQSLRNQSQYLASASQDVLSSGDRLTAIALALEALPSTEDDRPFVAQAEAALTDALMLYERDNDISSVAAFSTGSTINNFVVTDDAHTIYVMDSRNVVTVWDTYTYQKLSSFSVPSTYANMLTDNDGNLLITCGSGEYMLLCYNREGQLLWEVDGCRYIAFCEGKNTLLAIRYVKTDHPTIFAYQKYELLRIDPESGKLKDDPYIFADSAECTAPALASDTYYEDLPVPIRIYNGGKCSVWILDPKTRTRCSTVDYQDMHYCISLSEEGELYILVPADSADAIGRYQNYYFYTQANGRLYCYDIHSGKQQWMTALTAYNYSEVNTISEIGSKPGRLFCQFGSAFLQLDAKTGKILAECHAPSTPLALTLQDNNVWTLLANGTAGTYGYDNNTLSVIQYMEDGLLMGCAGNGIYVLPELSDNVVLYRPTQDDSYEVFSGEYNDHISQLISQGDYLLTYDGSAVNLFNMATRQLLWIATPPRVGELLGFSTDSSRAYICYSGGNIIQLDVQTGTMSEWLLPYEQPGVYQTYFSSASAHTIAVTGNQICSLFYNSETSQPYIAFTNCETYEYEVFPFLSGENAAQWEASACPAIEYAGEQFVLIRTDAGTLYRFDCSTGQAQIIMTDFVNSSPLHVNEETCMIVFAADHEIRLIDAEGRVTLTIPLSDTSAISFCDYGQQLLALCDDGMVYRFAPEGSLLSTTTLTLSTNFSSGLQYGAADAVPISWIFTPDGELILNALRMGNVINAEQWSATCDIPYFVLYHEESDSYICQANSQIYAYKRHSLGDTIQQAEEALNGFTLTDAQKLYYGLN